MQNYLFKNTTSDLLLEMLKFIMKNAEFNAFRLVGGTALSLQIGHRKSVDIDLFTDQPYGSIDFDKLLAFLKHHWPYFDTTENILTSFGKSAIVGNSPNDSIKVDIFYTDPFINPYRIIDGIRLATIDEIVAMKMDVINRGGRKKDFWDIHELLDSYGLERMLSLHKQRYPYTHERELLIQKMNDFTIAEDDFDPICLKGKHWELVKLDLVEFVSNELNQ